MAVVALVASRDEGTADVSAGPRFIAELDAPAAAACVRHYPDDLADRPIAFDGTVVDIGPDASRGELRREDGQVEGEPWVITLTVNRVFRGTVGETVEMHTYNIDPTDRSREAYRRAEGQRFLVATGETFDVDVCGFTRPWSEQEAAFWAETFSQ